ncbi:MAG: carboxypeptidase-like regulatory domain-containing protein, partial [Tannerella sp.]|nr:carboxypeptidase-like regulatory domain-containing protein [Tannerella sp.]
MQRTQKFIRQTNVGNLLRKIMVACIGIAVCCTGINAQTATASKRIDVSLTNSTLKELFTVIEKNSNYRFLYDASDINVNTPVSAVYKNTSIDQILKEKLTNLSYEVKGTQIVVKSKPEITVTQQQQGKRITGTVIDQTGETVIGASVVVKGTTNGVITDLDGNFSLNVPSGATLAISYVGYNTLEIPVGNQTSLNITLSENTQALEEVIVIGYGTAKRQDYTGSVGSVKLENSAIANLPNMHALESLKGNIAGMNIGATTSAGGDPSMLIRGKNSISGTNDPLIILDGVIYLGGINDINPNDIANIDVLKDAVSAAAYGSRASNGVISIVTKKGRTAKPVITLNTSVGAQVWPNRPEVMNGEDWFRVVNERMGNAVGTTGWMQPNSLENYNKGIQRVWLDDVTRTGVLQDYQLAVSGAGKGLNYYLSTSWN